MAVFSVSVICTNFFSIVFSIQNSQQKQELESLQSQLSKQYLLVVDLKNSIDIPEIEPNTEHETMGQPPPLSELKCHETANLTTAFEWRAMA